MNKMIERKKSETGKKSATVSSPVTEIPFLGNNTYSDSQASSVGNVVVSESPPLSDERQNGGNLTQGFFPSQMRNAPPFMLGNFETQWQQYQENFMRNLIDARVKELVHGASKQTEKRSTTSSQRFDRFRPSDDQHSRESDDEDLISHRGDNDPVVNNSQIDDIVQIHNEDNQSEFDNSAAGSVHTEFNDLCTVDWKNFVRKVTSELKIDSEKTSENQDRDFKS